jgi:hypothetical protein
VEASPVLKSKFFYSMRMQKFLIIHSFGSTIIDCFCSTLFLMNAQFTD